MARFDAVRRILETDAENSITSQDSTVHSHRNKIPADHIGGYSVRPGNYLLPGATQVPGGINFTFTSCGATSCELLLFKRKQDMPFTVIRIPESYRIGGVYSIFVAGLTPEQFEYGYRLDGPYDPHKGLLFNKNRVLLDPYAKAVTGQKAWGAAKTNADYHARVVRNTYRWKNNDFLHTPMEDTVIYEMHVRSFTRHRSSGVKFPGTFAGIIEKIPYLKDLGVTAVELLPVFEFDEMINARTYGGKVLMELWGYNTVSFFAPNSAYTASQEYNEEGTELKELVRLLKENGIEVILDVVFNHTAEGNMTGPFYGFKGIDNNLFYSLTPGGTYYNFSGCGNALNCNNPSVMRYIVDCLRYWVTEYHIDGFRFDLASIMTRGEDGAPMDNPPLIRMIATDAVLRGTKLIAEPWDAGGLYQVGHFPAYQRWSEWNGRYRDCLRDFLKGNYWQAPEAAARITGSMDLYGDPPYSGYNSSINFITCHDGFTLNDLFSYERKHNEVNGWDNADGSDDNRSWNCGVEGPTDNESIKELRLKMMRNAMTALMLSRGTPMLLAGDEFGNTQYGNNNSYCQDNEISWLNWDYLYIHREYYNFVKALIAFRKAHPVISRTLPHAHCGLAHLTLCGSNPDDHEITMANHVLGIMYAGRLPDNRGDDVVYLVMDVFWEPQKIRLPALPAGSAWSLNIYTAANDRRYYYEKAVFMDSPLFELAPQSSAVFTVTELPL